MKTQIIVVTVSLVIGAMATGDSYAGRRARRFDCSEKMAHALERYERRRFADVKATVGEIKLNCPGTSIMDSALYYLGKAYLATRSPVEARVEFERLIQDFPKSPFSEEARFLLGYCSLKESSSYERDQTRTRDAIREITDFLGSYPNSPFADSARHYLDQCREKLANKEFMNAKFYEKIDRYEAATIYCKLLIEEYPESGLLPQVRLLLAQNLVKVSRPAEARKVIEELLTSEPNAELDRKARVLLGHIDRLKPGLGEKTPEPGETEAEPSLEEPATQAPKAEGAGSPAENPGAREGATPGSGVVQGEQADSSDVTE